MRLVAEELEVAVFVHLLCQEEVATAAAIEAVMEEEAMEGIEAEG